MKWHKGGEKEKYQARREEHKIRLRMFENLISKHSINYLHKQYPIIQVSLCINMHIEFDEILSSGSNAETSLFIITSERRHTHTRSRKNKQQKK